MFRKIVLATCFVWLSVSVSNAQDIVANIGPLGVVSSKQAAKQKAACENLPDKDELISYNITFHTADVYEAGTDGSVVVEIEGECRFHNFLIKARDGKLEQGTVSIVPYVGQNPGELINIRLKLNKYGRKPGWKISKVVVARLDGKSRNRCTNFDLWLAADSPNGWATPWHRMKNGTC